jgi:hypothetical protein
MAVSCNLASLERRDYKRLPSQTYTHGTVLEIYGLKLQVILESLFAYDLYVDGRCAQNGRGVLS